MFHGSIPVYANQWDIEGIIYCSSKFHWKGHNWAGETWIERDIDLYASFYETLKTHAPGFPTPQTLKEVTFVGNIDHVGEMEKETPGSDRIVEVLLDSEPGPVYLQAWGGTNTIARALKTIQEKHADQMPRVSKKAIIYIILDQDKTFRDYILPNWPDIQVLGSYRQFGCIAYRWDRAIPEPLHKFFRGPWMKENILENHGPLCARYEAHKKNNNRGLGENDFRSEGDSPAFMHQIRTGMGSLEHPAYGGWGGRFEREKGTKNVWRGARDDDDLNKPIWRWAEHFQNDWAARADWCVQPPSAANHNPIAVVNGQTGKEIVRIVAKPGATIALNATGSTDPDGDDLSYAWSFYQEPSTSADGVTIQNATSAKAAVKVPVGKPANEYHIILTVKDDGNPNLYAYRRVIVQSPAGHAASAPSVPAALDATAAARQQATAVPTIP